MKKTLLVTVISAFLMSGIYGQDKNKVVVSDKSDWHKIGEATVNFNTDRDEINVTGADKFAAIKFKVMDIPIHLMDLEVYFDDGDKRDINVNFPIKPQGESRVIELEGGERDLKRIVFVYKTIANSSDREARVEVLGLKNNEDKD